MLVLIKAGPHAGRILDMGTRQAQNAITEGWADPAADGAQPSKVTQEEIRARLGEPPPASTSAEEETIDVGEAILAPEEEPENGEK